ncbi:hypothetical protein FSARC_10678 [Fusarium sarcochroum]|uniref:Uncharacterized protein n=1 Tax=Fusarium sarcochroum TaxID=1208366 RepID=A0A8H4TKW3_9HYPO|nr:hypothetical protein FSARC_10678 [Fusarium sarcochroum]
MSSSNLPPLVHRQLVPADSISAHYDNEADILLLQASGNHVDFTRDIKFHRMPFAGGLLFELQGLVGPIIQGETPYDITDGFNIELPSVNDPSNTVVINTANKKGWVVPIQYSKPSPTQPKSSTNGSNGSANSEVPEFKTVAGDHTIVVPLDKPYTIKQGDQFKGKGGAINLAFDDQYSNLTDASIEDGKIEWTLVPFQTGQTEVAVFVGQEDPSFFYRVNYNVEIVSPKESVTSKAKATVSVAGDTSNGYSTNGSQQAPKTDGLPLSWDGFVNIGYNLIKKQYSDAALYEIDATPLTRKPVSNEWGLVNNRIVCGLSGNKTAIIQSTGWGEFGSVQVIDSPWLGDAAINWPVSLEIHDAFSILRKGGYKQPIEAVTLRQPVYPGDDQPFYIFSIGNEFIAVGVNDKKIQNFGVSEHKIQKA